MKTKKQQAEEALRTHALCPETPFVQYGYTYCQQGERNPRIAQRGEIPTCSRCLYYIRAHARAYRDGDRPHTHRATLELADLLDSAHEL